MRSASRALSPLRVWSPRCAIVHWHSPDAVASLMWACSQALRRPSRARYESAATLLAVMPMMGATSCGSMPSTSVYQSTVCQRSGRPRNARAVRVRSSAQAAGSSGIRSSSKSSIMSTWMSRDAAPQVLARLRIVV